MCGIAGIFRFRDTRAAPDDAAWLARMAAVQRHRGPDAQGQVQWGACSLAAQRLRILDLNPRSDQPMASDDGRLWLVYNGEIYNYLELRQELEALGARFRGDSDTEVLLRAYEAWGETCVRRLAGMWALALFDARRNRLWLSRDRFGIKPLYYTLDEAQGVLAFASEIKALVELRRASGLPVRAAASSIATFVATGLIDGLDDTCFEGVRRFPAATNGTCAEDGLRLNAYWSLPEAANERAEGLSGLSEPSITEVLRGTLDEAVRVHLRSDVPLGACLSGGLDSSTVVGLASRHVHPVRTFTVYYGQAGYDERRYSEQVVAAFGAEPSVRQGSEADLLPRLGEVAWHLDEPALGPSVYSMWLVMELASQHVKVVVDGQGGDEVFGGYVPYYTQYLYQLARTGHGLRFAREALSLPRMVGASGARKAARDAVAMALRPPRDEDLVAPDAALLRPDLRDAVDTTFLEWRRWPRVFEDDWLNTILYWELTRTRLPALLRYEDRLSMAFSIESRVPLLDHRVVELGFALPAAWKIRDGWSKWALRRAVEPLLPPEIVWRRDKLGFPIPLGSWLRNGLAREVGDVLFTSGRRALAYLDEEPLRATVSAHAAGTADAQPLIWRALSLEVWLERFGL